MTCVQVPLNTHVISTKNIDTFLDKGIKRKKEKKKIYKSDDEDDG